MARVVSALSTVSISASTTSANVTIPNCRIARAFNAAATTAFVTVGTTTATSYGCPIAPNTFEDFIVHQKTAVAAVLSSGTGTVYVTPCDFIL